MENLKIRVNSEAESKEVQEFLKNKGYSRKYSNFTLHVGWICINEKMDILCVCHSQAGSELNDYKEITFPQLRDLVVLKRNDVGDATHIRGDGKKYFHAKSTDFFYQFSSDGDWLLSTWMNYQLLPQLQPIEKTMKEYLRKNSNGTYSYIGMVRPEHVSDFMIEIPEGATKLVSHGCVHLPIMFVKPCADGCSYCYPSGIWSDHILSDIEGRDILWSRHTHPEELPFIDDEPLQSLNDQYAEIEQVRQNGLKLDNGKPRHSLLPKGSISSIIAVLEFGAKKYEANNWQKVDNAKERYYDAAMRHIDSWWNGEKFDQETGIHHLAHAATNLFFLKWFDDKDNNNE